MSDTAHDRQSQPSRDLQLRATVLDALGQAVVSWDLAGRITCANRAAAELFGRHADDMAGLRIDDLLPPLRPVGDDASSITDIARRGESWSGDARFVGPDGETFVAALVQRPLLDDEGQLAGAVAIITDTSDQRQAENVLRTRDQQLRTLMAHAPVIMWTVDRAGIMTYCEGAGLQKLGLSGGDFVGTSAFAKTDYAPYVAEHHRRALAGETFSVAVAVGGRNFEVHYSPLRQPRGAITGAMALAIDVTPRRDAEAVGVNVELTDLIGYIGHLAAIVDQAGVIIAVSRGWRQAMSERSADWPIADGVGMPYIDACRRANLFSDDSAERLRRGIESVLAGSDDLFRGEYVDPPLREGDTERWMLLRAKRLASDRGGAIVIHSDIARERRNADLEGKLRAASAESADRGRHLGSAAHELRSPLAVIRGYLSTIAEYHERLSAAEILDLVTRSEAAVGQLDRLVNDLLLLSKIDAGALPRPARVVSLREIMLETLGQLRIAHPERDFVLRFDAAGARVRGDREQLRNVIANLLDNAVKYSPQATPIDVDVTTTGDGTASVTILDRGPGVPAPELERIFSRFHRVRTATNATVPGAGIGLAVCRALIERHGGHIEASAPAGGGLAVTFALPLSPRRPKRG